jgi:hypothetical protein
MFFFITKITKENFVKGKKRGYTWGEVFITFLLAVGVIIWTFERNYTPPEPEIPDYYPPHSTRL